MIRIGIICPSEIALRRFLPALIQLPKFKFIGVAFASVKEWDGGNGGNDKIIKDENIKAEVFIDQFGGELFDSYTKLLNDDRIDAIYLPLPPALHYKWAKLALLAGKHILIEKPATISYENTKELIAIAKVKKLAVHENYMFVFHNQLKAIDKIVNSDKIGDIRLFRLSFGFPRRAANDFRYNKKLGGGALLDCGGYTIKYATMLLGKTARIVYANSNYINDFDVNMYGSAVLVNERETTAQIAFGMDNSYKCDIEIWGSKGSLSTNRIFTAPVGFIPEAIIKIDNKTESVKLPYDDAFMKSIQRFQKCVENKTVRQNNYDEIIKQAVLVDEFIEKANNTENGK